MKNPSIIIAALIVSLVGASFLYDFKSAYEDWEDPGNITNLLADDLTAYLSEEGIFYPSNDLDDPLLKHRKVVINTAMNEQTTKEVVRKLLFLNAIDSTAPIDLYISTQGGWYDSAFTIIDTFQAITAPVNTFCIGGCYSAGAIVVASGTGERIAYSNSLLSIHIVYGDKSDTRPYAELPDRVNTLLQKITKLPKEWFPLEDDRNYYLTAFDAEKFDLIDEIRRK